VSALRANLLFVSSGLALLGTVMVYSATVRDYGAHYLVTRGLHVALGLAVLWAATRVRYTAWRRLAPWLYGASAVLLVLVLVPGLGTDVGGARRWFDFGPISLQPAELAKLAVVIVLSAAVSRRPPGSGVPAGPLAAVGLLIGLVVIEPDFGTSVVMLAGAAGALWASELRTRDLVVFGGASAALAVVVMLLEPYRRERFMAFLNPWELADGPGYQVVQSMLAIGMGSIFGTGVGSSDRSAFIPEVHTDMIFALIGEELGLLGMIVVIAAFLFLTLAGIRIALGASTTFGRCIAGGLTAMLAVQAFSNIGAAMSVVPLAGMTLPFVSYGGSSIIVSFAAVGILYRISEDSERAREAKPQKNNDSRRRHRGARDPRAVRRG
jgi:cell division protein FtsW